MTAGKSTRSAAKDSKLAVKINEADKWKPRTDFTKERQRPAPQIGFMEAWPSPLTLFEQDYLNEFREKNPKDKSPALAVYRKAFRVWRSLSHSDKAPYQARSLAAERRYRKAAAKTPSYRETWDLKCKMEVEMDKMNI